MSFPKVYAIEFEGTMIVGLVFRCGCKFGFGPGATLAVECPTHQKILKSSGAS